MRTSNDQLLKSLNCKRSERERERERPTREGSGLAPYLGDKRMWEAREENRERVTTACTLQDAQQDYERSLRPVHLRTVVAHGCLSAPVADVARVRKILFRKMFCRVQPL